MIDFGLPLFSYDVVVIDPPWPWKAYSDKGLEKSPEAQYVTMSMADIAAMPVGDLLAPGGMLIMWGTWPLIEAQATIMRGWGVPPVTGGVWAKRTVNGKLRWGTGFVLRSVCEPFLIGRLKGGSFARGKVPNLIETLSDAAIDGLAREHSRKPEEFFQLIETLVPVGRRADIFSRQRRPGWDGFGNEAEKFPAVAAA
ncbi:MT-A70 family methyltransferase [Aureimonas pseudogalii]|uniref:N6-adenosine-specific RNA methylase IME4 n=1 Tax=Aureimonas pseudogalii TaxID=1744844 RepID=A0A7W6E8V7_9HYPH|nr:MT-A70 family methyltransferase [Aureimonas pseudogalii]MBB3996895.1 N6-adenosine-specific RNA methylase IME4 [Aureimonas pseudogalii]